MRSVSIHAISWIRKGGIGIALVGLLQIFGAPRASADTLQTFTVATSGWAQLFQMCSPCPADPFPIDATSTITIDTSTGKLVASHVTGSGTSPFSGTVPFSFQSQQSGSGYTLLTFSGSAAYSIQGNGTFTIQLNIYVPVASLVGYSGGALCSATNPCAAGATVEVIQCVGTNCTGSGAYTGTYTANAGQLTATTVSNSPNAVPLIYPLVPSATAPGGPAFTLTVNGTGFVSGAVVNWDGGFGPLPLTTTFVSSSQVTAAVPAIDIATAGTAVVTVTNPGPGGGTSNSEDFQVTNALTATNFTVFANNEIDVYKNRTSNTLAGAFSLGRGGHLDVAAYANGVIYVLPGNGNVTFGNWIASPGPPPPPAGASDPNTYLAAADINGDGIQDLVIMNSNGTFVALGNGDRTFRLLSTSLSDVIYLGHITIADFNGDGFLDLGYSTPPFTVPATATAIQVLLGNGDGTFRTGPATVFPLSTPNTPAQFLLGVQAAADLNGDGKLDLLVSAVNPSGCQGDAVWLLEYPGNGDGSFGTPSTVPGTSTCGLSGSPSALVGDFNGDGKLDVAYFTQIAGFGAVGYLAVDLGNGDGTFGVPSLPLANENQAQLPVVGPMLAGDFNGDGKLDLMLGNQLFYGNGDGTFAPSGPPSSAPLQVVQVGDFDGDGKTDLLALGRNPSNSSQFDLRLLLQIPAPADFGGGLTPMTQTVVPGNSVNYAGTVTSLNGFTGSVALSASGMPAGVTASFNPATIAGGSGSYTLTLAAASSVTLGTYTITVTGTSGSLSHSGTVTLIVNSSAGDFSSTLANSDSMQNIVAGQTATYNIQVSPIGGYNGDVTLSVSGGGLNSGRPLPGTATFNPTTIHGASGTSTLTIVTQNPVPYLDVYQLTITATSGPLVHQGNVFLGISNSPGDFTGTITPSSQTITVGQSATYTANITYLSGFTPPSICVAVSVSGLPPGAQFNVTSSGGCNGGQTDTFTISAPAGTPTGTYNLLLIGNAGDRIRARAFALTIQ